MRENTVKAKWRAGEVTYGAWLTIPSSVCAEAMAHAGYDWLCIDTQHGVIDYKDCVAMLTAISTTDTVPFVRPTGNDFAEINRVLDAGAMGVVVPLVNSAREAEAAVSACRYAPRGARSWGPTRATYYAGADYFRGADEQIACIVMIETKEAVDRLDEILTVPGVDAVYVGPSDLSITLGLPPGADNGGAFEEARLRIAKTANARGVVAGMHANASLAAKHVAAGYRMITITQDLVALGYAATADLRHVRGAAAPVADTKISTA